MDARERRWVSFIKRLNKEERARLFDGSTEMIVHDEFIAGRMSLAEIRLVLNTEEGS